MYSLHLSCRPSESEFLSAELWEAGTIAVREMESDGRVELIAGFETNNEREELLERFADHSPRWRHEPFRDWVAETQAAWPARGVGERFFLAPVWSGVPTPSGRTRIMHNPGLACGTGEHPCTQLALMALEKCVTPGCTVVDVGTGSGLLAIAALRMEASRALGLDLDEAALRAARENFELNGLSACLAAGSGDCVATAWADVTVANINATVLLSIFDDLARITRPGGWLILTGFPKIEARLLETAFLKTETIRKDEWCCVTAHR